MRETKRSCMNSIHGPRQRLQTPHDDARNNGQPELSGYVSELYVMSARAAYVRGPGISLWRALGARVLDRMGLVPPNGIL